MQGLPIFPTGPSGSPPKSYLAAPPASPLAAPPSSSQFSDAPPPPSSAASLVTNGSAAPEGPPMSPAVLRDLRPLVLDILRRSNIKEVSRKSVIKQLVEDVDGLAKVQKFHALSRPPDPRDPRSKSDMQELVRECFEEINEEMERRAAPPPKPAPPEPSVSKPTVVPKREVKQQEAEDDGEESDLYDDGGMSSTAGDAALAARLQAEANGRPSRSSRSSGSTKPKAKKTSSKRKRKTDDLVGSDEDPDASDRPTKPKKAPNPNNPFNRPMVLDERMEAVCGEKELSRPQVVKALWAYIKGNQLQDPSNGRKILCDDKLEALFGKRVVDSFEMAKLIGSHLHKKEDLV